MGVDARLVLVLAVIAACGALVGAQSPPLTAVQLLGAAHDSSLTPESRVELILGARGREVFVNDSLSLWEALQEEGEQGVLSVVLQGDVTLDGEEWASGQPITIPSGRVVTLRADLNTDAVDVSTGADSLARAGAVTLNMAQREEVILVEAGAMLALEGLLIVNQAVTADWIQRQLATGGTAPHNWGMNPAMICLPGCSAAQRWTMGNFYLPDCSRDAMEGLVYRVGLLVGNTSQVVLLNDTAYGLLGAAAFDISLLSPNNTPVGELSVVSAESIFNCNVRPGAAPNATAAPAPQPDDGGGVAAWVWVLVGLAGAAALAAVTLAMLWGRAQRRRRAAEAGAAADAAQLERGMSKPVYSTFAPSASLMDKDLDKAPSDPHSEMLQELWSARRLNAHGLVLLERIASGGFASVWRARWKGNLVAAKIIEHDLSRNVLEAIRSEATLSMSVSHPNVVQCYAVHTVSLTELCQLQAQAAQLSPPRPGTPANTSMTLTDRPFTVYDGILGDSTDMGATIIVQELCSRSVERCMEDPFVLYWPDGSPDQVAIVRLLVDTAQGLDYLASVGVVHGDVKAANVLLCTAHGTRRGWQAKVADLGLSRMLPPDATSMAAPAAGTVAYMAPELIGHGRLTLAADVYSFGILMCEVWSRRPAYPPTLPLAQLTFEVVTADRRPGVPPGCPAAYAELMQECWDAAPERRPTFEEVARRLQGLLRDLLAAGVPDTASRRRLPSTPRVAADLCPEGPQPEHDGSE